jgi:hypothetical protein
MSYTFLGKILHYCVLSGRVQLSQMRGSCRIILARDIPYRVI